MIRRIILGIVLTVLLLSVSRKLSMRRPSEVESEAEGIRLNHTTISEQKGAGEPTVNLTVVSTGIVTPFVLYRSSKEENLQRSSMVQVGDGQWEARLPDGGMGARLLYAFEVVRSDGDTRRLPEESGSFFLIKFKGTYSSLVLILHIAAMFGSFFFMFMSFFSAIEILKGTEDQRRTVGFARWVLILSFLGGWPLGFILNYQAFGVLWEAFPFGFDITDNKTQLMFVFWLISLLLVRGSFLGRDIKSDTLGPKGFAFAVIVSFVVSLFLFIVPHSL